MNIIEHNLQFRSLSNLGTVKRVVLHHAEAENCTVDQIHQWHLNNGWAGCGYHFVIYKDGSVHRGRPEWALGAHVQAHNTGSIGVCFVGAFNRETMSDAQIKAGQEIVSYLLSKYRLSKSNVCRHKDLMATDCPGNNFPFDAIVNGTTSNVTVNTSTSNTVKGDDWVRRLQEECNRQGFSNQKVDGIPGKNTLAGCPTVRKGATGNITRLLQEKLGVSVDGIFGANTRAAVIGFQNTHGLSADGIVGQNTWRKLLGL